MHIIDSVILGSDSYIATLHFVQLLPIFSSYSDFDCILRLFPACKSLCVKVSLNPFISHYDTKSVFLALGITAVVCIVVTVFCFQTKVRECCTYYKTELLYCHFFTFVVVALLLHALWQIRYKEVI